MNRMTCLVFAIIMASIAMVYSEPDSHNLFMLKFVSFFPHSLSLSFSLSLSISCPRALCMCVLWCDEEGCDAGRCWSMLRKTRVFEKQRKKKGRSHWKSTTLLLEEKERKRLWERTVLWDMLRPLWSHATKGMQHLEKLTTELSLCLFPRYSTAHALKLPKVLMAHAIWRPPPKPFKL